MVDRVGVETNTTTNGKIFTRWTGTQADLFVANVAHVAQDALNLIRQSYVPVDTGALRDSGRIDGPFETSAGIWNVDITFDTAYAAAVNYRPKNEGRHDPGRPLAGSHYMERGVLAAIVDIHKKTAAGLGGNPPRSDGPGSVTAL
jgi:hypothetical protein